MLVNENFLQCPVCIVGPLIERTALMRQWEDHSGASSIQCQDFPQSKEGTCLLGITSLNVKSLYSPIVSNVPKFPWNADESKACPRAMSSYGDVTFVSSMGSPFPIVKPNRKTVCRLRSLREETLLCPNYQVAGSSGAEIVKGGGFVNFHPPR